MGTTRGSEEIVDQKRPDISDVDGSLSYCEALKRFMAGERRNLEFDFSWKSKTGRSGVRCSKSASL